MYGSETEEDGGEEGKVKLEREEATEACIFWGRGEERV